MATTHFASLFGTVRSCLGGPGFESAKQHVRVCQSSMVTGGLKSRESGICTIDRSPSEYSDIRLGDKCHEAVLLVSVVDDGRLGKVRRFC